MHNAYMQDHYSHMNLVHNPRQDHMCLVPHLVLAYDTRTSRRDHMYKTRCLVYSRDRSRRTLFSSRSDGSSIILTSRREVNHKNGDESRRDS